MNDETPTFKSASYVAEIGENSPRATPILFLGGNVVPEVFDYDSGTNGTFQLFLEGDQGIFEVRKNIFLDFPCYFLLAVAVFYTTTEKDWGWGGFWAATLCQRCLITTAE